MKIIIRRLSENSLKNNTWKLIGNNVQKHVREISSESNIANDEGKDRPQLILENQRTRNCKAVLSNYSQHLSICIVYKLGCILKEVVH